MLLRHAGTMSHRPRIVVTSALGQGERADSNLDLQRYLEALLYAGAEPVTVPKGNSTAQALGIENIRGVLFTGGGDIDAACYNGDRNLCARVDVTRDYGEIELFQQAYFNNVPILAICRGMQLANVALGGSLIEDIPTGLHSHVHVRHHSGVHGPERFTNMHGVRIRPDSELGRIVGKVTLRVNSVHHQAIRRLSEHFVPSAESADGIIEAIESENGHPGFFIGVQWHLEAAFPIDKSSSAVFAEFVLTCRKN